MQEMLVRIRTKLEIARGLLHGADYSGSRQNALKPMREASNHIRSLETANGAL